ncbi:hypothetical protein [Lactobacillus bombicola]|uniref:hypothetical protein n=1 Tax=Lactobacillus bombicola TaxID=1505723 RepID=UPI0015FC95F6|nr:hypothetical protein [Lactobacillus bombicola]
MSRAPVKSAVPEPRIMNPIGSYIIIKIEKILSIKNDLTTTCKEALTAPPSPPVCTILKTQGKSFNFFHQFYDYL